jgi:hypothetical protein
MNMEHCTGCYALAFVGETDRLGFESSLRSFQDAVVLRRQTNSQGEKEYLPCTSECEGAKVRVLHFYRYDPKWLQMWKEFGPAMFYDPIVSYGGRHNWPYLGASQYWEFIVGEYKDGKNVSMNSLKTSNDGFYLITLVFPQKNSSSGGTSNSEPSTPSVPLSNGGTQILSIPNVASDILRGRSHANLFLHPNSAEGAPSNPSSPTVFAVSPSEYINSSLPLLSSVFNEDGSLPIDTPDAFEALTKQMKFDEFLRIVHVVPSQFDGLIHDNSDLKFHLPQK